MCGVGIFRVAGSEKPARGQRFAALEKDCSDPLGVFLSVGNDFIRYGCFYVRVRNLFVSLVGMFFSIGNVFVSLGTP